VAVLELDEHLSVRFGADGKGDVVLVVVGLK
jgi:hypothetical protein